MCRPARDIGLSANAGTPNSEQIIRGNLSRPRNALQSSELVAKWTDSSDKMKINRKFSSVVLLLLLPLLLQSQGGGYGRGRRSANPRSPASLGAYQGVTVTFHGKLKDRDKNKIEIETDESQLVTIMLSGKTKFFKNGKEIKASLIDLETVVSVDASEDRDLSILAIAVTVDSPPEKTAPK